MIGGAVSPVCKLALPPHHPRVVMITVLAVECLLFLQSWRVSRLLFHRGTVEGEVAPDDS